MVKLVQCVTRKPGMDTVEFRQHWYNYGRVIEALARQRPNLVRFRLNTTLMVDENVRFMMDYGIPSMYDGMLEVWLEDAMLTTRNLRSSPEAKEEMAKLIDLLREFVDPAMSTMFYTIEDMEYDKASASAAD